jgi:hypothetical protein
MTKTRHQKLQSSAVQHCKPSTLLQEARGTLYQVLSLAGLPAARLRSAHLGVWQRGGAARVHRRAAPARRHGGCGCCAEPPLCGKAGARAQGSPPWSNVYSNHLCVQPHWAESSRVLASYKELPQGNWHACGGSTQARSVESHMCSLTTLTLSCGVLLHLVSETGARENA